MQQGFGLCLAEVMLIPSLLTPAFLQGFWVEGGGKDGKSDLRPCSIFYSGNGTEGLRTLFWRRGGKWGVDAHALTWAATWTST